jgi:hypothetical protein
MEVSAEPLTTPGADRGLQAVTEVSLMFPRANRGIPCNLRKATTQQYLAWLLAALVVLFCFSTRLSGYKALQNNLKSVNTRAYFDSEETRLGTSLVVLLLLWWAARASILNSIATAPSLVCATGVPRRSCGGFDLDFHVRPPPRL